MITIKSDREIELLKKAGNIVYKTHQYLIPYLKEGITTLELDRIESFLTDAYSKHHHCSLS